VAGSEACQLGIERRSPYHRARSRGKKNRMRHFANRAPLLRRGTSVLCAAKPIV